MAQATTKLRFVDLFAGIGGFHRALVQEFDAECVLASDIDAECRRVYAHNFPDLDPARLVADIRSLTRDSGGRDRDLAELDHLVPDHDVLCGGFPCQPFSKSGAQQGFADTTRGTLFFDIVQILRAKQPRYVILENVRNIAGPRHRDTWKTIIESLREVGYAVNADPLVLSPHRIPPELGGSPQWRERVFIVAERVEDPSLFPEGPELAFPNTSGFDPSSWDLECILQDNREVTDLAAYRLRPEERAWLRAWNDLIRSVRELPSSPLYADAFDPNFTIPASWPEWKQRFHRVSHDFYLANSQVVDAWLEKSWTTAGHYTVWDFPDTRRILEWQARSAQPTMSTRNLWKLVIQLRPSGVRVKTPSYLPALVAINQAPIIGSRKRRITPVEAARLQGMPDDVFDLEELTDAVKYKQAGNAVNVGVVRFVARALIPAGMGDPLA